MPRAQVEDIKRVRPLAALTMHEFRVVGLP
jgi:hypothetical protein